MPVPLLKHHFCRRAHGGPKAHAHAAYLSGTQLDDGFGRTADFTPKGGICHAELWIPPSAPPELKDRGRLWRSLEARESKTTRPGDAILAHKFIGALPHELSLEENIRYIKDFVREQFIRKGYAADWAIHKPDPGSDSRNYHVHIMVPLRKFESRDWAKKKDRFPTNSPALSHFIRSKQTAFFELQNRYLEKNGIAARLVYREGRWSAVDGQGKPISTSRSAQLVPDARRGYGLVAKPSSQPAPSLGGNRVVQQAPIHTTSRYAAMTRQHHAITSKKGWPKEAVQDWEAWGHRDPIRFFRLWPELSGPGFSPGI